MELIKTRIMTYPASMGKIGPWAAMRLIRSEEMHQPRWMPRPILDLKMTRFFKGYAPAIVGSMPFAAIELGCSRVSFMWSVMCGCPDSVSFIVIMM